MAGSSTMRWHVLQAREPSQAPAAQSQRRSGAVGLADWRTRRWHRVPVAAAAAPSRSMSLSCAASRRFWPIATRTCAGGDVTIEPWPVRAEPAAALVPGWAGGGLRAVFRSPSRSTKVTPMLRQGGGDGAGSAPGETASGARGRGGNSGRWRGRRTSLLQGQVWRSRGGAREQPSRRLRRPATRVPPAATWPPARGRGPRWPTPRPRQTAAAPRAAALAAATSVAPAF